MNLARFRWWWVLGNLVWFLLVPVVFALWLSAEVDAQYASGLRTNTDGDSLSIPLAAVVLLNGAALLVLNAALGLFVLSRRRVKLSSNRRSLQRERQ